MCRILMENGFLPSVGTHRAHRSSAQIFGGTCQDRGEMLESGRSGKKTLL